MAGINVDFGQWNAALILRLAGSLATLLTGCFVATIVYRLTLHPLAKLPGPKIRGAFYFPHLYSNCIEGSAPATVLELHKKYGPVVRIGPNHASVDGAIGWPEVFAYRTTSKLEFVKPKGHFFPGDDLGLLNAPKERHRRIRRRLGQAFSDSALADQAETIEKYTDLLMQRMTAFATKGEAFNIVDWLNYVTFDIVGDLTFSDSYGCLENNGYHPWVLSIFLTFRGGAMRRFFNQYPLLQYFVNKFSLSKSINQAVQNRALAAEKAVTRLKLGEHGTGKADYMSYMMKSTSEDVDLTPLEIMSTAPLLVLAGSETTATTLAGLIFYLNKNPDKRQTLLDEIRGAFASENDITTRKAAFLDYLGACLDETMRIYPPTAETPPRISPGAMVGGHWFPPGSSISIFQWSTFRNPDHFADPDSFAPERWLPKTHPLYDQRFVNDNKSVFKPFSYGSRDCIGKNFAYTEMRILAARMFWRFDFALDKQDDWHSKQQTFMIWLKGPLNVKLTEHKMNTAE